MLVRPAFKGERRKKFSMNFFDEGADAWISLLARLCRIGEKEGQILPPRCRWNSERGMGIFVEGIIDYFDYRLREGKRRRF